MSYFEQVSEGDTTVTDARTVTEADIVNFAGLSGDFNRLHTDAEYMADSEYGERIAHGALVFALMTGLMWQSRSPEEQEAIVAYYGLDAIRFLAPTYVGDTIHVESTVVDTRPTEDSPGNGTVHYETEVINQRDEPVLYCEPITLMR